MIGLLAYRLIIWPLANGFLHWIIHKVTEWLMGCFVDWLTDWLIYRLTNGLLNWPLCTICLQKRETVSVGVTSVRHLPDKGRIPANGGNCRIWTRLASGTSTRTPTQCWWIGASSGCRVTWATSMAISNSGHTTDLRRRKRWNILDHTWN